MSESFESEIERLKSICRCYDSGLTPMISIPWVHDTARRLEAAHKAEMKQLSKTEYHRGYEDGKAARKADEWQLDRERAEVVRKLLALKFDGGSHENLSRIARAIHEPTHGWTIGACEALRGSLVWLLGGYSSEQPSLATYDELGNERHKAVCELRKMHLETGSAIKKLAIALGIKWNAANAPKSCAMIQSRLIHLLGGDQLTLSDLWGIWAEKDPKTPESVEIQQEQPEKGAEDAPITLISDTPLSANGTASNDNGTCPNGVPIASITGELREWVIGAKPAVVDGCKIRVGHMTDGCLKALLAIADRIDEQWERAVQEVHDSMEAECEKLRAECDELKQAANHDVWTSIRMTRYDVDDELEKQNKDLMCECGRLQDELVETRARFAERANELMELPTDVNLDPIGVGDTVEINGTRYKVTAVSASDVWINVFDDEPYRLVGCPSEQCVLVSRED